MYAAAMTSMTTAEKPADLTAMRRATNPVEQLRRAAEAIEAAERQLEPRRLRSNAAAVILFRRGQAGPKPMQPAAMWRDTIEVSRSLWHKIMVESDPAAAEKVAAELAAKIDEIAELSTDRAAELPQLIRERDKLAHRLGRHRAQVEAIETLQAEIDADPEVGRRLLAIAREDAKEARRLELLIPEAKKVRDELVVQLINGKHGRSPANSDVAKLAKISAARVAQLRKERILM